MRAATLIALVLIPGCGGSPTAPSPAPTPAPPVPTPAPTQTVQGTLADTVTGQALGTFTQTVTGFPARVLLQHPGYVTRDAVVHGPAPRVDLFPEAGFDLAFYRQFARDELRGNGLRPLQTWTRSPAIRLQPGTSPATATALERSARQSIPQLTGGRYQLAGWEIAPLTGTTSGWMQIELVEEPGGTACGRAELGGSRIWLNTAARCRASGVDVYVPVLAHELGHALGFSHVTRPDTLMHADRIREAGPSEIERHHAALAYTRQPGNTDLDVDPIRPTSGQTYTVVD